MSGHILTGEKPYIPAWFERLMWLDEYGKGCVLWGTSWDLLKNHLTNALASGDGTEVMVLARVTSQLYIIVESSKADGEYQEIVSLAFPSWKDDLQVLTSTLQCHAIWFDWWSSWGLHIFSKGECVASDSGGSDGIDVWGVDEGLPIEEYNTDVTLSLKSVETERIDDDTNIDRMARFFGIQAKNYFCSTEIESEQDREAYPTLIEFFQAIGIPIHCLSELCGKVRLPPIIECQQSDNDTADRFRYTILGDRRKSITERRISPFNPQ